MTHALAERLAAVASRSTLRLTTFGRKTGKPHPVPVWFMVEGSTVFLGTLKLKRDWPRNVKHNPSVKLEIGDLRLTGRAHRLTSAAQLERVAGMMRQKYWAAWIGSWFGLRPEGAFRVEIEP